MCQPRRLQLLLVHPGVERVLVLVRLGEATVLDEEYRTVLTLLGLLERWYNMDAGDITIDGRPISTFNLAWLRTKMRLVQQEPVLFNGTVIENVAYGLVGSEWEHSSKDVQMAQVIEACKLANADGFINALPEVRPPPIHVIS